MGISVLTAITIGTNYPQNIKVLTTSDDRQKHAGYIYLMRDGAIHTLLLSTPLVYPSAEEAETSLKLVCEGFRQEYGVEKEANNG